MDVPVCGIDLSGHLDLAGLVRIRGLPDKLVCLAAASINEQCTRRAV